MKIVRDYNIEKNIKREINLQTRRVPDKTKFSRKQKHKDSYL